MSGFVVLTLALGIGASTAVFSIVNPLLLQPLPYPGEHRLVFLNESWPSLGYSRIRLSYPDFADWRDRQRTFAAMAAYRSDRFTLTERGGEPERLRGASASAELFPVLGVAPLEGRTFRADEDRPGGERVVVLGESLWRRRFAGDPAAVGRVLSIDAQPHLVVGIMPRTFEFPEGADLWVPLQAPRDDERGIHWLSAVGRLAPRVTLAQARADLDLIAAELEREHPETNAGVGVFLRPLRDELVGEFREAFLLLLASVALVLLIACANVTNILLARVWAREREFAVRAALGAPRWRVVRLLFAESLLLSSAGGLVGIALGVWGKYALVSWLPVDVPRWMTYDFDTATVLFAVCVAGVSAAAVAMAPIVHAVRPDLEDTLKDHGIRTVGSAAAGRLRSVFVAAQVSLALVVLVGAGLMTRTFLRVHAVDPGFQPEHVLVGRVELPPAKYADDGALYRFGEDTLRRLAGHRGVEHAATASTLPLAGSANAWWFVVEGAPPARPGEIPLANGLSVSTEYFEAMRIPVLRGRRFTDGDGPGAPPVTIVNERLARQHGPGEDPVGKRVKFVLPGSEADEPWTTVIGVVADVRHHGLDRPIEPEVYVPHAQVPVRNMWIVVRSADDPLALAGEMRAAVRAIDRDLPLTDTMTLVRVVERSAWTRRLYSWMLGVFGAVALFLAGIGVYAVVAYSVSQREREIGVRMALGAGHADVRRLVVQQSMWAAGVGMALGLAVAYMVTPRMSSLLFDVTSSDPLTYALVATLLAAVALLAAYAPVRRATRVDPAIVLRTD